MCEYDYIDAFEKMGINAVELYINEIKSNSLEEKAESIGKIIRENSPIFVFSINYFPYVSIVCESLDVKYVSVSVTCPMVELYNVTIKNKCNKVFLFDYKQYLSVKNENPDGIFYLPLGANVERMMNVISDCKSFLYDVSFVGSLYNEKDPFTGLNISSDRNAYYEKLMLEQIEIVSSGQDYLEDALFDNDVEEIKSAADDFYSSALSVVNIDKYVAINNYLSPHMTYIERVKTLNCIADSFLGDTLHLFTNSDGTMLKDVIIHGGVDTFREMPRIIRQSKINLNISARSIKTGIPQRVWDVLGSGGFLITNYQDEISEYFSIGEHLEVYENEEELIEKIRFYLEHDDVRKAIARSGHELVKNNHTVFNRAIDIIKAIAEEK